jgi:hypothetical protein
MLAGAAVALSGRTSAQSPERIDFARDIQPLLRTNCYGCHGASLQIGNFRLDRRRDSMPNRVGANNARIVPGKGARELIALQRTDGGWGQIPTLGSDAYATGQALTALAESGAVKPGDPAYEKGVRFLLGTQLEDGSWYIRSRAVPIQPYFDSEFPHGTDQFISAAATNWATMALAHAVR